MIMIDVAAQIDAVTRELEDTTHDGEEARVQRLTQDLPATLPEAWGAVTDPARITSWFQPVSGDLTVGGNYQIEGNAGGTVLACDPPRNGRAEFRVTWEFGGNVSWLEVRLRAVTPERTRVELAHTAPIASVPAEMWNTYGPGATGVGWDGGMLGLALNLGAQDAALSPLKPRPGRSRRRGRRFTAQRPTAGPWLTSRSVQTQRRQRKPPMRRTVFIQLRHHPPSASSA